MAIAVEQVDLTTLSAQELMLMGTISKMCKRRTVTVFRCSGFRVLHVNIGFSLFCLPLKRFRRTLRDRYPHYTRDGDETVPGMEDGSGNDELDGILAGLGNTSALASEGTESAHTRRSR